MTADSVFSACNLVAVAGWILLLAMPRNRRAMTIAGTVVPLTLAGIYLCAVRAARERITRRILVARCGGGAVFQPLAAAGGLGALPGIRFVHRRVETRDAMARGVSRLLLAPSLVMTFMLGPSGCSVTTSRALARTSRSMAVLPPVPKAH